MDRWVRDLLVEFCAGKDETERKLLIHDVTAYAAELAGPSVPSGIERTLIETAAIVWFYLRLQEQQLAAGDRKGMTLAVSEHRQRRVDRAHHRLMSTLRTLAQVRRMALPALQVNIGANQVNAVVAAPAG